MSEERFFLESMRDMTPAEAVAFKKGFELGMEFAFAQAAEKQPELFGPTLEMVRDRRARWEEMHP